MKIIPLQIKDETAARKILLDAKVTAAGTKILAPKSLFAAFKISQIRSWEANIIKQHMLSLGADAAIERQALVKDIKTEVIVFGSVSQLKRLAQKLKNQPFSLNEISGQLLKTLENIYCEQKFFIVRDKVLNIKNPVVCGIINVTPDSFSGDGILGKTVGCAVEQAERMIKDGARMLDIGAQSSRPGSMPISEKEEIKRLVPVLRAIRKSFPKTVTSVDAYLPKVIVAAVDEGADVINDITALRKFPKAAGLIKKYKLGCVLMHMQGNPKTMQIAPEYKDVTAQVFDFFLERLDFCDKAGIDRKQIMIDPGIGFGKRLEDNLRLIKELESFKAIGVPIFIGLSRKSFVGKILDLPVSKRINGSLAASIVALMNKATVLRTHDVKETFEAIKITQAIIRS
jgi:dihydropteroate synthase